MERRATTHLLMRQGSLMCFCEFLEKGRVKFLQALFQAPYRTSTNSFTCSQHLFILYPLSMTLLPPLGGGGIIWKLLLGPEIILVRGCENVTGKLKQKW